MGARARLGLLAGAVLAAVVLFLVLRPDGDEPTSAVTPTAAITSTETVSGTETESETDPATTAETPQALRFRIQAPGDGSGSIRRLDIERGQRVTLIVRADVVDHVHVHGYDLMDDVAPGSPARITFRATTPGRFEVELEDRALQIAELRVGP